MSDYRETIHKERLESCGTYARLYWERLASRPSDRHFRDNDRRRKVFVSSGVSLSEHVKTCAICKNAERHVFHNFTKDEK